MKAEILSIGSELTSGQNLDTNSQWLSLRLAEIGIPVNWHTTVADDLADNIAAFRVATQRADLVVATGGLGPTLDDLTREVLAEVAGVPLVFHAPSLAHIEQLFATRKRAMPERNRVQAEFPQGAEPLFNPQGSAPGIWMQIGSCHVAAMPGVPAEMHVMFTSEVKPRLERLGIAGGVRVQRKINTFGAGESHIEEKLLDLTRRGHVPEVGITASGATISLRIFAQAPTLAEAQAQIAPVEKIIRERLGTFVFGVDDEELEHAVFRLLSEKRLTLATAESVTGGLAAHKMTKVPGASQWLKGGLVSYDTGIKVSVLGVPQELIDKHGVNSVPVVEAMAVRCRELFQSDLAVATVGLAGPSGDDSGQSVGQVHAACAWEGGVRSASTLWGAPRVEVQERTAKMALNLARLRLEGAWQP